MSNRIRFSGFLAVVAVAAVTALAFSGSTRADDEIQFPAREVRADANQTMMSNETLIAVNRDKDTVWGYGKEAGDWKKITLQNPEKLTVSPVVGQTVACVSFGNDVHGFSALTGTWDTIHLDAPAGATVGNGVACVSSGNDVHAFSATTGSWDTLHLDAPAEASVGNGWATVESGTKVSVFSEKTGKWETVDLAE